MAELQMVELAGTPSQIGESYGEQFREEIQRFAELRLARLVEFVAEYDPERNLSRADILAAAARTVPAHRQFDQTIWDEFEGIARAAGLTVEELLIGNGLTDLRDLVLFENQALRTAPSAHVGECTAFLAPSERTGGPPILGQTWDMHPDAGDYLALVRRRPSNGPSTLALTTVGCLCLIGVNSDGVAVGNNNLVPTDAQLGVNYLFTITRALGCASAEQAADAIERTPRLSGHNFLVADATAAINVETTATRSHRTPVEGKVFVHANHYIADGLKPFEFAGRDLANTHWRQARLIEGFASLRGRVTLENSWTQLAAITQGPDGACNSTEPTAATIATVVQRPGDGTFCVCAGPPTEANRQLLSFS